MVLGKVFCDQIKVMDWRISCDFEIGNHFDVWKIYVPKYRNRVDEFYLDLSELDKEKCDGFNLKEDKERFILGRYALKELSRKYLKVSDEELEIEYLYHKKPVYKYFSKFNFNISHSKDYVIIGFANNWSVGVDVEYMRTDINLYDLIINCMSNIEISSILNSEKPRSNFYRIWTRKESLLKGIGLGITDRIKDISCNDGVNFVPHDLSGFAFSWKVWSFEIEESYAVSLAHETALRVLRFYEF